MFNIVLYEPEIPPNTGNIIRLCAVTACSLHLIKPLGFSLDDKHLKRAGLDYELNIPMKTYENFNQFKESALTGPQRILNEPHRTFLCSTKAQTAYSDIQYQAGDVFVFGPETRGLPNDMLDVYPESQKIKIPMAEGSRSLNLSNAVAIIIYEGLRQNHFKF